MLKRSSQQGLYPLTSSGFNHLRVILHLTKSLQENLKVPIVRPSKVLKHLTKREPLLKLIEDRSSGNHAGLFPDSHIRKQNNQDLTFESNPIKILEIMKDTNPMPTRLYLIHLELEHREQIEIEACEGGFMCEKD